MIILTIIITFFYLSVALPTQDVKLQNVITVPSNCPQGQELVNGHCREIWRWRNDPNTVDVGVINRNVITVPPNCPPGQQWINGACRDVWRHFALTTPLPERFEYSNLEQRKKRQIDTEVNVVDFFEPFELPYQVNRNIINIPNQCPIGYRPDAFGICRQILV